MVGKLQLGFHKVFMSAGQAVKELSTFFLCFVAVNNFQFGLYLRKSCTMVNATDVKNQSNLFKITSLHVKVKLKNEDQSKLNFIHD